MTPRHGVDTGNGGPGAALARADARRADPAARDDVLRVYLALSQRLAPETPEGTERLRFLLEHVPRSTQGLEELFSLTATAALDPDVADRALIAAATFATARGDFETTFARLREALLRRRGSGTAIERAACINLARALRLENRPAEALLVARRAVSLAVTDDEPRGAVAALGIRAGALLALGEPDLAEEVVREVGTLLPDAPQDAGTLAVRAMLSRLRIDIAHRAGRFDEALWRIDVVRARENAPDARRRAAIVAHRAHVLLDAGRASDAALAVRQAREHAPEGHRDDLRLAVMEARVAAALGDEPTALERASHALDRAERLVGTPGPHRFWAGELVPVFEQLEDVERGRRCLEILATERLEQIARVDSSSRDIPELTGEIHPEDRAVLVRARERALVESRDVLDAFARLLAPAVRSGDARALVLVPGDDDLIRVCAWCARVAGRDGRWLPLGHMIPTAGSIRATHGMCPDCLASGGATSVT